MNDPDFIAPTPPGQPARAVMTHRLRNCLAVLPRPPRTVRNDVRCTLAWDRLAQCGLRDGLPGRGQSCIDQRLAAALQGDVDKGVFFRGAGALPIGERFTTVRALIEHLLKPGVALGAA
jgi:nitronate monooxygenase